MPFPRAKPACPPTDDPQLITALDEVLPRKGNRATTRMFCLAITAGAERLITGGEDGRVISWPLHVNKGPIAATRMGSSIERLLLMRDDGTVLASSNDGSMAIFRSHDLTLVQGTVKAHEKGMYAALFIESTSQVITGGLDGRVRAWNRFDLSCVSTVRSSNHGVLALLHLNQEPADIILAGNVNGQVTLVNFGTRQLENSFQAHDGVIFVLKEIPGNDAFLSAGEDSVVRGWSSLGHESIFEVHTGQGKVMDVLVLDSEPRRISNHARQRGCIRIATAGGDGTIATWKIDLDSGVATRLTCLPAHDRTVEQLVLDSIHEHVYSISSTGSVKRWNL